jgi:transcriptional regulator with XRE-family HTH domain
MVDNHPIGNRLKERRRELELTLKAIEARAGVSATHISEIERGKTSPTIGSLSKIAAALGKDITYFLEKDELDEVSHLRPEQREAEPLPWGAWQLTRLTRLVPGARLAAYQVRLDPNGRSSPEHAHEGNELYHVLRGTVRFAVAGQEHVLATGDSLHLRAERSHRYVNAGPGVAEMLFFTTQRHTL